MNKNNIIGFVLIGLIMFGFTWYQAKQYEKQAEIQAQLDSVARVERMAEMAMDSLGIEQKDASADFAGVKVMNLPAYKDSLLTEARLAQEGFYMLSNDKIHLEFTTRGAQPYSVRLNDYRTYDSTDLYLIKPNNSRYGISVFAGENINTKDFVFQVAEHTDTSIVMRLPFMQGGYIQQEYRLSKGSYMVENVLSFVGMDNIIPRNVSMLDIDWSVIIPRLEKGYRNEKQYSKLDYYYDGDKKPEEIARNKDQSKRVDSRIKWFAFQQQFFSAIMTSGSEFASADFDVRYFAEDDPSGNLMAGTAKLRADFQAGSDNIVIPNTFYFGPNDYRTLKQYDLKYEKIIPLGGWLVGWISRFVIIPIFDFLGRFISNYGLIILIMTLIIKIVIMPLTIKSYKSSAKIQVIKPELDKINEKYPNEKDAMKKQQATMELYQRAGISPMGGCLPMLLQFPILFAMFRFFPASIELRQQKFLWADDLSAYDSIWDFGVNIPLLGDHLSLFALLMAVTMFFYTKMTSGQMSNDPNMAGMKFMSLYLMPVMMFFICNNLSAALSYYYLLSNIITMIVTWYIRKYVVTEDKVRADMMLASKTPKKKSKWQQRLEEAQRMQEQMQKQQKRR
ncbi:MAG: membrane protein insertase YidC [Bacteroidales bacterium]|nr:membrane protein insertase YidC [Bacteroidales bacterium]MBQ6689595.1 membrane protein insertase YidC [Bacteroidales bacterium]